MSVKDIDRGWNRIQKEVLKFQRSYTAIGYFYAPGSPKDSIAARALVNEFGTKDGRIPERPFNRETFDKSQSQIKTMVEKEYNDVVLGKSRAFTALSRIGEWYTGKIKLSVRRGGFTPNKPKTMRRKKSTKPLIDTGEMLNSVEHREFIKGS